MSLRVSGVQVVPSENYKENLVKAEQYIRAAVRQKADLVVFPEMFMAMPLGDKSGFSDYVSGISKEFIDNISNLAVLYSTNVVFGGWEACSDTGKVFNTLFFVNDYGQIVSKYRKMHLFDALSVKESDFMVAGESFAELVDLKGVTIGFGICYDLRFPEYFRALSENSVDLIILPAAWYDGYMKTTHWQTLLRARAIENTVYFAGVNLTGETFCGASSAYSPFGEDVEILGKAEGLMIFDVDKSQIRDVREKLPVLKNRSV